MPHSIIGATRQADKPRHIPPPGILLLLLLVLLPGGSPQEFGSHESRTSRQWLANDFSWRKVFGQAAEGVLASARETAIMSWGK